MFPLLLLLGGAALAAKAAGEDRPEVDLIRPVVPYAGPLAQGMIAVLVARQRTIEGEAPPKSFKVQIVGLPGVGGPLLTGVLLEPVFPMSAGQMLQFSPDKIAIIAAGA